MSTIGETVDTFINAAIFNASIPVIKALLVAWWGGFGWPIISQLIDWALNQLGKQAYKNPGMVVTFGVIDNANAAKLKEVNEADAAAVAAYKKGDPDEFKKAIARLDAAADAVVRRK